MKTMRATQHCDQLLYDHNQRGKEHDSFFSLDDIFAISKRSATSQPSGVAGFRGDLEDNHSSFKIPNSLCLHDISLDSLSERGTGKGEGEEHFEQTASSHSKGCLEELPAPTAPATEPNGLPKKPKPTRRKKDSKRRRKGTQRKQATSSSPKDGALEEFLVPAKGSSVSPKSKADTKSTALSSTSQSSPAIMMLRSARSQPVDGSGLSKTEHTARWEVDADEEDGDLGLSRASKELPALQRKSSVLTQYLHSFYRRGDKNGNLKEHELISLDEMCSTGQSSKSLNAYGFSVDLDDFDDLHCSSKIACSLYLEDVSLDVSEKRTANDNALPREPFLSRPSGPLEELLASPATKEANRCSVPAEPTRPTSTEDLEKSNVIISNIAQSINCNRKKDDKHMDFSTTLLAPEWRVKSRPLATRSKLRPKECASSRSGEATEVVSASTTPKHDGAKRSPALRMSIKKGTNVSSNRSRSSPTISELHRASQRSSDSRLLSKSDHTSRLSSLRNSVWKVDADGCEVDLKKKTSESKEVSSLPRKSSLITKHLDSIYHRLKDGKIKEDEMVSLGDIWSGAGRSSNSLFGEYGFSGNSLDDMHCSKVIANSLYFDSLDLSDKRTVGEDNKKQSKKETISSSPNGALEKLFAPTSPVKVPDQVGPSQRSLVSIGSNEETKNSISCLSHHSFETNDTKRSLTHQNLSTTRRAREDTVVSTKRTLTSPKQSKKKSPPVERRQQEKKRDDTVVHCNHHHLHSSEIKSPDAQKQRRVDEKKKFVRRKQRSRNGTKRLKSGDISMIDRTPRRTKTVRNKGAVVKSSLSAIAETKEPRKL